MKKQSFVFGVILLAISGVLCKILGAIYKIPLTNILGLQGMGIYYLIFPIYAVLITLTSSSFTMALSKLVSNEIALNQPLRAFKFFKASCLLLFILGLIAGLGLAFFCKIIASLQGYSGAYACYLVIAPAMVFVSLSSAFKGYFQGLQNMIPTAVSQIVEQIIKLAAGFALASVLVKKGVLYGAVGALLGVSLSEVVACTFFFVYFIVFESKNKNYFKFQSATEFEKQTKTYSLMKQIFKASLPFTLTSVILPMAMVVDSFLIVNILKSMNFDKFFATSLLGLNSGIVNTLVSLPSTLSMALCMSIVPYISFALSKKDFEGINQKTVFAIKSTLIIALPCVLVFLCFSPNIIRLLYSGGFDSIYEYNVASSLLMISGINVLYLAFLQITTALLQAINHSYVPVFSLAFSLVLKVAFEVILVNIPYLNIFGAVISNCVCYFSSSLINLFYLKKKINPKFNFYQTVFAPLLLSLVMTIIIFASIKIFALFLSYKIATAISFVIGAIFYVIFIFVFKVFSKQELQNLKIFKQKSIKKVV